MTALPFGAHGRKGLRALLPAIEVLHRLPLPALVVDVRGRVQLANAALLTVLGRSPEEVLGTDWFSTYVPERERAERKRVFRDALATAEGPRAENAVLTASGEVRRLAWSTAVLRDLEGEIAGLVAVASDVSYHRSEGEQVLLAAAIDHSDETVVITDAADRILFVNAAFERLTGYARDHAIGQVAHLLLRSDDDEPAEPSGLAAAKSRGEAWAGEVRTRRKDGSIMTEAVRLQPIRDPDSRLTNFVTLARDVTAFRALEATVIETARERIEIAEGLRRLEPGTSLQATAQAICDCLVLLVGVDFAAVHAFEGPGVLVLADANSPIGAGSRLGDDRAARLRERAAHGPWAEISGDRPEDGVFSARLKAAGVAAMAFGPITVAGTPVGLLVIGTTSASYATHLVAHLPAIAEFGAIATALLGAGLLERRGEIAERTRIQRILDSRAFSTVFQPVVELKRGHIIGFEALSRFPHRENPESVFAAAERTGLGPALEAATLHAALLASEGLPTGPWLSLNVSPEFAASPELADLLQHRTRPIVLEITEHHSIADYAAIHEAVDKLGPDVLLAVDDAGSGIANFDHIVGLRPSYVKLDISLVRGLHADVSRQALIAGIDYFARTMGIHIIAEGVEADAELAALRRLDVLLAQGYLLGRPADASLMPDLRSPIVAAQP